MLQLRLIPLLLIALVTASTGFGQTLRQRASDAYQTAQQEEIALKEKPLGERSRSEYLRVVRLYERVYLITPHTGYADNALINIAALYQEIDDARDAIKTLQFLIREYPGSRFISSARENIEHLTNPPTVKPFPIQPTEETGGELATPAETAGSPERAPAEGKSLISVDNLRYWESKRSVRVVVDLDGKPSFTQGDVKDPARVFVDIADARLSEALRNSLFPVESVMLENIRLAQHDSDTVRVVLDLVQLTNVTTFTLREPDRLVIDVIGDPNLRTVAQNEPPAAPAPETPANEAEETPEEGSEIAQDQVGTPARPTANGDHSLIRSLGLKVGRVVIDAGHGGKDTGTTGPTGLTEKALVLDIAHKLKQRIETELGAEVVMTREDDAFVPLETRTAIANQAEADLFLSIHANASHISSIRGFETYFLNFTTSKEGLQIAARENAASQRSISELQDIVSTILLRDKVDESREFAAHVQRSMATRKRFGKDRGVKQAPFVVLVGANMPSILAEVSFISNPDDERLLKGEDRRQQIAEALFEGVRSYSDTLSGFRAARIQD